LTVELSLSAVDDHLLQIKQYIDELEAPQDFQFEVKDKQSMFLNNIKKIKEDLDQLYVYTSPTTQTDANRQRRALLPIVGTLTSKLFGVATTRQLHRLAEHLINTEKKQDEALHIVAHSATVLNHTKLEVQANRRTINILNARSIEFSQRLNNLSTEIQQIMNSMQLERVNNQIELTIEEARININDILRTVEAAVDGRLLPELLPPQKLQELLRNISTQIPRGFRLVHEHTAINLLYRVLKISLLPIHRNKLTFIIPLPIVNLIDEFDIYQYLSVPTQIPHRNKQFEYTPESEYLIISRDRTYYIVPNELEVVRCIYDNPGYCVFNSPYLHVTSYKTCIQALFWKEPSGIVNNCHIDYQNATKSPIFKHISAGKWLKSYPYELPVHQICLKENALTMFRVPARKYILDLDVGCSAKIYNQMLPAYFHNESRFELDARNRLDNNLMNLNMSVFHSPEYKPFDTSSLRKLDKVNISVDDLIDEIKTFQEKWKTGTYPEFSFDSLSWEAIAVFVIILSCIILSITYKVLIFIRKRTFTIKKSKATESFRKNSVKLEEISEEAKPLTPPLPPKLFNVDPDAIYTEPIELRLS